MLVGANVAEAKIAEFVIVGRGTWHSLRVPLFSTRG